MSGSALPNSESTGVSATRDVAGMPRDTVEVGLRNKYGESGDAYPVSARVIAPDGSSSAAAELLCADEWVYLSYPADFDGGNLLVPGNYTVVWELEAGFIACDGFVVKSR